MNVIFKHHTNESSGDVLLISRRKYSFIPYLTGSISVGGKVNFMNKPLATTKNCRPIGGLCWPFLSKILGPLYKFEGQHGPVDDMFFWGPPKYPGLWIPAWHDSADILSGSELVPDAFSANDTVILFYTVLEYKPLVEPAKVRSSISKHWAQNLLVLWCCQRQVLDSPSHENHAWRTAVIAVTVVSPWKKHTTWRLSEGCSAGEMIKVKSDMPPAWGKPVGIGPSAGEWKSFKARDFPAMVEGCSSIHWSHIIHIYIYMYIYIYDGILFQYPWNMNIFQ